MGTARKLWKRTIYNDHNVPSKILILENGLYDGHTPNAETITSW